MGVKRKIRIGFITFIILSVLGYIFYPIVTLFFDIVTIWLTSIWFKKIGVKTTFTLKRGNK